VLKNYQFSPQNVTVRPGDTVTFQNQDTVPHHVVVGTTDLGVQQPGATATWASGSDETLTLKCLFHASMVGQITVGNGGSGAPTGGTPPSSGGSSGGYAPPPAGGYGY
jgi:plastocyanin